MSNVVLNDMRYSFEPLKLFLPNPEYKVDEKELKKSMQKSREMIQRIRNQKDKK